MQRTLTPRQTPTGGGEPPGLSPLSLGATPSGSLAGHGGELTTQLQRAQAKAAAWKDKAHRLGDLIVRQETQCHALQRQLDGLRAAQHEALAAASAGAPDATQQLSPADLAAMRSQLVLAQAQLRVQAEELEAARADYDTRHALLKEAAGTARREVLGLQDANRQLQAAAERLQKQNDELLAAQLRGAQAALEPGSGAGEGWGSAGPSPAKGWGSAGPSPAKRHADTALLHALVRKQDGELSMLREDSASQAAELMRSLSALQVAHQREEDLRRQVHSLEGQMEITQDELAQKDAQLEALRERHEEQQSSLRQLGAALAAAEEAAAAAASASSDSNEAAAAASEAAALRERCQQAEEEAAATQARLDTAQAERDRATADQAHLRESLQQRDAEVAQLRRVLPELRAQAAVLEAQLAELAAGSQAATAAKQQQAEERDAELQRELEELRAQLQAATQERAQLEQQQAAAGEAAQATASERAALQQQLEAAEARAAALQAQLESALAEAEAREAALQAAEADRAALAAEAEARAADLERRLEAAAAGHDATRRALHRLQGEVSDAELLLASLGSFGSRGGSLMSTPAASPKRLAASEECRPAGAAAADAGTYSPASQRAVQWLQQKSGSVSPVAGAAAAAPPAPAGCGPTRLHRRIQSVLAEVQRLQQQQQQQQQGGGSGQLSPEDSAVDSAPAQPAAGAAPEAAASADGTPQSKLPLLSPVQSDNSSTLIPAVHATPDCATPAALSPLGAATKSPLASPRKARLLPQPLQQRQLPSQQGKSQARGGEPAAEGRRGGRKKKGGALHLIRTAGIAGVLGAAFMQVLQHARPR